MGTTSNRTNDLGMNFFIDASEIAENQGLANGARSREQMTRSPP